MQNLFPNHSIPIQKTFWISIDASQLKINPTQYYLILLNPNLIFNLI